MTALGGSKGRFPSWPAIPAALASALIGQFLLLSGRVEAGVVFYLAAAVLVLCAADGEREAPPGDLSTAQKAVALVAVLSAAFLLRRFEIGSIPWGLNNDEGIEGLIACRFLSGEKIAPFSSIGLSRETLYHVLLMPLFRLLGPGIPALRLLSLLCALVTLPLLYLTGREFFSARTGVLAAALLAFSPWHLLYSRTGFRNILLPIFVLGALACFRRALESRKLLWFVITGAVLGVGMYSYTSFRVIPIVLVAWALLRRLALRRAPLSWRETGGVLLPFLLLMVPQIAFALGDPGGFIARGAYVLAQTPRASLPANLLHSLLMPVHYPARYGVMQSLYYFGDGVSLVYAAVGRTPETAISAAVMACGLLLAAVRLVRRRSEGEGVLLLCFGATLVTVGLAGPSLTRLIGNLPLLCLAGALFLEEVGGVIRRRFTPAAGKTVVLVLLAAAGILCYEQYFLRAGTSPRAMFYYAAPQTLMGLYAAGRVPDHPVTVLYTEEPETLQFLTFARRRWVTLENDPSRLDLAKVRAAEVRQEFIVENDRRFLGLFRQVGGDVPRGRVGLPERRPAPHGGKGGLHPERSAVNVPPPSGRPPGSSPPPGGAVLPGAEGAATP